jgi:ABC-type nitrate/sulfonate/bicarbonate transport system substrate-binding protein
MPTRTLRGRGALLAASLISLTVCVGCGAVHTNTSLGPARRVVVALPGPASALYAPIFEAMQNGDFARGALSVSTTSTGSPLSSLASGSASIAIASEPALLSARDSGEQLVAIGALERAPLDAIISLSSRPVSRPSQLIGKTVATTGTPLATAELATYLGTANIPISRVHTTTPGNLNNALTTHKALATVGGLWDYDAVALALSHHKNKAIPIDSAGVPAFTQLAIVVRLGEAHHDGALLRAFLQSLTRGESAARANPQAAVATLASFNPSLSKALERAVLLATDPVSSPVGAGEPYGFQNQFQWVKFGTWMLNHGLIHHVPHAGLAITDEFLPGQGE